MAAFNPHNPTIQSLTGEIGRIEKNMAKYLFKKYLVPVDTSETKSQIKERQKIFLQELFPTRPEKINESDELTLELNNITQATLEYARCPEDYPTGRTQWGYPDNLRCNHISYVKHRFSRCSRKISNLAINTPSFHSRQFCAKHLGIDNTHLPEYSKLANIISSTQSQQQQPQNS